MIGLGACNNSPDDKVKSSNYEEFGLIMAPEITIEPLDDNWQLISTDSYEIKCPVDWELEKLVDHAILNGVEFGFVGPKEDAEGKFQKEFNLWCGPTPKQIDLDTYVPHAIQMHAINTPGFVLLENKPLPNHAEEGQMIVYSSVYQEFKSVTIATYWSTPGKLYSLSFNVLEKDFASYQSLGMDIISSFKLK